MFPKILLIGQSFNRTNGGGITLSNLFTGWPKDSLAVAASDVDGSDDSVCDTYYRLGYKESARPFPFYLWQKRPVSGPMIPVARVTAAQAAQQDVQAGKLWNYLKRTYLWLIKFFGIDPVYQRLRMTPELSAWIDQFEPDIIYSQLSTYDLIRVVDQVAGSRKKPVVIHIMDDWPTTISHQGILSFYWSRRIDAAYRRLLQKSIARMGICQAMCDAYERRYEMKFLPFHNPIDLEVWRNNQKNDWSNQQTFKIVYGGVIGTPNVDSLVDVGTAVARIQSAGKKVCFEIVTPDANSFLAARLKEIPGVSVLPKIPHAEMPEKLRTADLLLIPLSFDKRNILFTQYSMPGKTSEYMASGTPVLAYAPPENALITYARDKEWGRVVDTRSVEQLVAVIQEMMDDEPLRRRLGTRARDLAFQFHNAAEVRRQFQTAIIDGLSLAQHAASQ